MATAQYLWRRARAGGTLAEVSRTFTLHSPAVTDGPLGKDQQVLLPGGCEKAEVVTEPAWTSPQRALPATSRRVGNAGQTRAWGTDTFGSPPPSFPPCSLWRSIPGPAKPWAPSPEPGVPPQGPRCPSASITRWQPAVRNESPAPAPPLSRAMEKGFP